ncbi:retrovirus-related pol polyprotein from transposon TNT 1-94 [Tanacetum coccineum]
MAMASSLSHLNFDTINDLARNDLVTGLPKFKYHKEHLCPSCEQGKSKRASHPPKPVLNSKQRLHLLHMDLCGSMRVESINGKRYVLVIVDDYSRYTWVHILRTKDEALEVIKTFLKKITVLLQAPVIMRLLLCATLKTAPSFTIDLTKHHTSSLTAENQTSHFYMYSGLSVIPRMTVRTLGSLVQKVILASSLVIRILPVLTELQSMTSGQISSTQQPTKCELDLLFEAMYDDYIGGQPSAATRTALTARAPQVLQTPAATTTTADTALTPINSSSQSTNIPITSPNVDKLETQQQHVQQQNNQASLQLEIWSKDHPLEQVIGEPSRPVLTRNQLRSDGDMCMYALTVSTMEPKNVKEAMTDPAWIESM